MLEQDKYEAVKVDFSVFFLINAFNTRCLFFEDSLSTGEKKKFCNSKLYSS